MNASKKANLFEGSWCNRIRHDNLRLTTSVIFLIFCFLQSIQEGITALKVLIGNLEETGSDLVKLSGPGEGSSSVEENVAVCVERYELLQLQTDERGIKIGMTLAQEEELQNRMDDLLALLEKRKDDFGNLQPVSVRPAKISHQIEEMKVQLFSVSLSVGLLFYSLYSSFISYIFKVVPTWGLTILKYSIICTC